MDYTILPREDKFAISRVEGETPVGELLDTAADWSSALELLNRFKSGELPTVQEQTMAPVREKVELTIFTEMAGAYPQIPLPSDINREALGSDVLFVTLPVGQFNSRSRNGRNYSEKSMRQMAEQINSRRPEGIWGHIPDEQFSTYYGPPAMRWLAAHVDEQSGVVWAKGLPLTAEAREYYRLAKITNARVGTSLFAYAMIEGEDVTDLDLITIDLADPARVGVPMTAARPFVSTEMAPPIEETPAEEETSQPEPEPVQDKVEPAEEEAKIDEAEITIEGEQDMTDDATRVQELSTERDTLRSQLDVVLPFQSTVNELAGQFGVSADKIVEAAKALLAEKDSLLDEVVTAVVERKVKVVSVRPFVADMVRNRKPNSSKQVKDFVDAALETSHVKSLIATQLSNEMGGNQPKGNSRTESESFFTIPSGS